MPKKLTKSERLVDEQVLARLEWASDHPDRWHKIGNLEAMRKAAELLAQRGVIEIWPGDESISIEAGAEEVVRVFSHMEVRT
jgi:hypothetical protein